MVNALGVALLWPLDLIWHLGALAGFAAIFAVTLLQGRRAVPAAPCAAAEGP